MEREGAVKDGTPFILGPDMRPAEPLCSFFFHLSKSLAASTLADYAHDLLDLAAFLSRMPVPLDLGSAGEDDLLAYREYCIRTGSGRCRRPPGSAAGRRSTAFTAGRCTLGCCLPGRMSGVPTVVTCWPGGPPSIWMCAA
ncbi:MAG TPA: hypothetical protein VIV12_30270 [Streptosporangiaceae bacterium]